MIKDNNQDDKQAAASETQDTPNESQKFYSNIGQHDNSHTAQKADELNDEKIEPELPS